MKNNKLFITLITLSLSLFLYNYSLSQNVINNDTIFTVVDNSPEYPGGMDSLIKFINYNVRYPSDARDKEIQGSVFVTFIVNKDGSINNPTILRGIGSGCDEEAIRVVKLMPNWEPGKIKGKPVPVQYNLPINFNLKER